MTPPTPVENDIPEASGDDEDEEEYEQEEILIIPVAKPSSRSPQIVVTKVAPVTPSIVKV